MIKQLLSVVLLTSCTGLAAAQEAIPAESPPITADFLIRTLQNRDESIRREAFRRLQQDETIDALPRLVEALRTGDQETATRAALAFAARLDFLRRNTAPNATERLLLTDEDKQQLALVADLLSAPDVDHWRWYLAEWAIEQVAPSSFNQQLPALNRAVREDLPMRQYAAVRAMLLVDPAHGDEVKESLLAALRQTDRPRFIGVYMRNNRTIENNRVAFTYDVWSAPAYSLQFEFYSDDQFLILAALLHFDATFDEIGPALVRLSHYEHEAVRLQAAEQLVQLGSPGRKAADATLGSLLSDRGSPLVRQLADEDRMTRERAIALVGGLEADARDVVEPLARLLDSSEDRLRQSAAIALGQCGPAARPAIPALRKAIETESLLAVGAVLSPEAQLRAKERYADMQTALQAIEAPSETPPTP